MDYKINDLVEFEDEEGQLRIGKIKYIYKDGTLKVQYRYDKWQRVKRQNILSGNLEEVSSGSPEIDKDIYLISKDQEDIAYNQSLLNDIKTGGNFDNTQVFNKLLYSYQKAGAILASRYNKFIFFYEEELESKYIAYDIISQKYKNENAKFLIISSKRRIKSVWLNQYEVLYPNLKILHLESSLSDIEKKELLYKWKGKANPLKSPHMQLLYSIFGVDDDETPDGEKVDIQLQKLANHFIITPEAFIKSGKSFIRNLNISGIILDGEITYNDKNILNNYFNDVLCKLRDLSSHLKYLYVFSNKQRLRYTNEYYSYIKLVYPECMDLSYKDFLKEFCIINYSGDEIILPRYRKLIKDMLKARTVFLTVKDCGDNYKKFRWKDYIASDKKV